ncbi:MAG TPA: TonB family protein [Verrucomicrobiae bacterium]|nr:TonB family protein [Verrucomicrobiae bacterium]
MNRLQKKCVIGTAGIHLLLLTILLFGPAFFNRQPKTDNTVLDVIPANLVDSALNSGVRDAQAPPPAAAVIPPSLLRPPPPLSAPAPAPLVQPPPPAEVPTPSLLEKFKEMFRPTPTVMPDTKPVEKPEKSHDENVKVNLTKVTRRDFSKNNPTPNNTSDTRAINSALNSLKHSLSSSTRIDMPGNASAAYANYATVVKSVYERAIVSNLPDQVGGNNEHTLVRVTIARDGTVISSTIVSSSGDSIWDSAVQRTLDQVTVIAPFPDGATEQQRTYTIDFNPQVAREL